MSDIHDFKFKKTHLSEFYFLLYNLKNYKMNEVGKFLKAYKKINRRLQFLENLMKVNDQSAYITRLTIPNKKEKCGSVYNKSDLASLFYFLMDENILFFNLEDRKLNRGNFQNFMIENFTYCGDGGQQSEVISISKQFSECKGFTYREKQISFLNNLVEIIQKRKERLMYW